MGLLRNIHTYICTRLVERAESKIPLGEPNIFVQSFKEDLPHPGIYQYKVDLPGIKVGVFLSGRRPFDSLGYRFGLLEPKQILRFTSHSNEIEVKGFEPRISFRSNPGDSILDKLSIRVNDFSITDFLSSCLGLVVVSMFTQSISGSDDNENFVQVAFYDERDFMLYKLAGPMSETDTSQLHKVIFQFR